MRLISWNILQGGGKRLTAQVAALAEFAPDIVALQEVRPRTAPIFKQQLASIGLVYSADSFVNANLPPSALTYGVLVASRWPLSALPALPELPLPERVISVRIDAPGGSLEVHNTYIPVGSPDPTLKIQTLSAIYRALACSSPVARILCGDFNMPQAEHVDGTLVTFGQQQRPGGLITTPGLAQDSAERNIIRSLADYDLPDAFRLLHGYTRQDFSWYYRGYGLMRGFRLDHIFATPLLNVVECEYLHHLRENRLSDHAPLMATFRPNFTDSMPRRC